MDAEEEVSIVAKHTVRASPRANKEEGDDAIERIHLTPWDLTLMFVDYSQKGLLFHKPRNQPIDVTISDILTSFSNTLDHFYPLAGRLSSTKHDDSTVSISLDCTNEGAEFIHASASHVNISDILTSSYVPPIVYSFFPLNGIINHDGHSNPLLAVQVTELADGIFIACSFNHAVADGTSFWHFFNAWSTICRTNNNIIEHPPVFERWFPDFCPRPVQLSSANLQQYFMKREKRAATRECTFSFSAQSIKKLKTKANEETGSTNISSLQALLAHAWRSVTRARNLEPEEETNYVLVIGHRSRLAPPLAQTYFGNSILGVFIKALAGEVETKGLGWTARLLNQVVVSYKKEMIYEWVESWTKSPSFVGSGGFIGPADVFMVGSPKFDEYGNDFGWGKPVAVRTGQGGILDGKVTVHPGLEVGSMELHICLSEEASRALLDDRQFMEVVA